jgi:erythromycin esterase-like protein
MIESIKKYSKPFESEKDIDQLIAAIGDSRIVLLGESSHGTSEFYKLRAEISKKLIEEKGFHFIAVEGDWPASDRVNQYVKGIAHKDEQAAAVLEGFKRWPTWMWANEEIIELISWVRDFNSKNTRDEKVGFYGLDVYSLWESMEEIINYLKKTNSPVLKEAVEAFACFEPFQREVEKYAISAGFFSEDCIEEVTELLTKIRMEKHKNEHYPERQLNLEINALVAANAENYYRTMVTDDNESWNVRDRHMVEALNAVMDYYGHDAKVIVWEHNTHVGDARATDMADQGMTNVGQIVREQYGADDVFICGFGTHRGTVIASDEWGVDYEVMTVPEAEKGSWEDMMHEAGTHDQLLVFTRENQSLFEERVGHRAIGVVYNPAYEHLGNYVPSVMSRRYNAFIHVDQTTALKPLTLKKTRQAPSL